MPKLVEVDLESAAPYSQSRQHDTEFLKKEQHGDYETRTWREKCNYDANGIVFIPAMAFKQALDDVAKMLGEQIPGKGKNTYTKHFKSGVMCHSDVSIGVKKDEIDGVTINANSEGVRGSGKRVKRTFPVVASWKGTAQFAVLDDTVTPEIFERFLTEAGRFIGVGRFRPQNGGLNGRFKPTAFRWQEL